MDRNRATGLLTRILASFAGMACAVMRRRRSGHSNAADGEKDIAARPPEKAAVPPIPSGKSEARPAATLS
jgi:hypothetical protein